MIIWKDCKVEDFSVEYHVEENHQSGERMVFAVGVYFKDKGLVFTKSVTIRSEFYQKLIKLGDWDEQLRVILKSRVRDEILKRIKVGEVPIENEIKLMSAGNEKLS